MTRSDHPDHDDAHTELHALVERIAFLVAACAPLEGNGPTLIAGAEWMAIYGHLIELHELLADEASAPAIGDILLKLGLKLTVLEAIVECYVGGVDLRRSN